MPIEHPFGGPGAFVGNVNISVLDPNVAAFPPSTIIQRDHNWAVKVDWQISGSAVKTMNSGQWLVKVFIDSIGPGFEGQVGATVAVPVLGPPPANPPGSASRAYTATINAPPPNTVPGQIAGTYKLTTVVNHVDAGVQMEIAGFQEGPVIQFYDA